MPHDKNGELIKPGEITRIRKTCEIAQVRKLTFMPVIARIPSSIESEN